MTPKDQRAATANMWALADYTGLAQRLDPAAVALVDAAGPGAGEHVLDAAAGTGNVAMRAAARGARVTACDIAPRMVQLGRERTGPAVEWIEADVEDLPLPDMTVDVALSAFGVIFAPHPEVALSELHRVLAPGGRLGLTAWTIDGWIAERARIVRQFVPPDPTAADALGWGDADVLEQRLSTEFTHVRIERLSLPWHFDSGAALTGFLIAHSPAHVTAMQAAGDRADEMVAAIERHASPEGGPVRIEAEYLLALARRPGMACCPTGGANAIPRAVSAPALRHQCTCAGWSIPATATAVPVRCITGTRLASAQPSTEWGCAAVRTATRLVPLRAPAAIPAG